MELSSELFVPLSAAAGASFALIGIAYRMGTDRGITPLHIILVCSAVGAAYFTWADWPLPLTAPGRVWAWGIATGVTQYLAIVCVGIALQRGPLSPTWCAVSLSFLPETFYAALLLGEGLRAFHWAAMGVGVVCVVVASFEAGAPGGGDTPRPRCWGDQLRFGAALLGILLFNSVVGMAMKDLNAPHGAGGERLMDGYGGLYRVLLYVSLGGTIAAAFAVRRRFGGQVRTVVALGLLAAVGSIVGVGLISFTARGPAALVFTVRSVASILVAALLSVALFRERISRAWVATVLLAVATVVLANLPAVGAILGVAGP